MNLHDLFEDNKPLQTKNIFTPTEGVIAIQVKAGAELKQHTTKIPALLLCVSGEVIFENEKGISETFITGDFVNIEPNVKHWVKGIVDSNILLIK